MPSGSEFAHQPEITMTGIAAISSFLDANGIAYEVREHEPTMSATAEARETNRPQQQIAKTVVLHDHGGYLLAVVPASNRINLHSLRDLLGATKSLRLATEDEIARDFPTLEVGAAPPFGPMMPRAEVIDRRLLEQDQIICAGGDHRHSVKVDPRDVTRITDAMTADICEE
jgi:Ala-tRNA(Pro) deacylase